MLEAGAVIDVVGVERQVVFAEGALACLAGKQQPACLAGRLATLPAVVVRAHPPLVRLQFLRKCQHRPSIRLEGKCKAPVQAWASSQSCASATSIRQRKGCTALGMTKGPGTSSAEWALSLDRWWCVGPATPRKKDLPGYLSGTKPYPPQHADCMVGCYRPIQHTSMLPVFSAVFSSQDVHGRICRRKVKVCAPSW